MNNELIQPAATLAAAIIAKHPGKQDPASAATEFVAVYRKLLAAARELDAAELQASTDIR